MIATLSGIVAEKIADQVVLEVGGVGYGLLVTQEDSGALVSGRPAKLHIYEHIRENAHDLFGFIGIGTKQLFELLLTVNGVGPKMALNVLSIGTASDVRRAVAGGNVKFIVAANGVGKRVAERIVVDLKDKVGLVGVELDETGLLYSDRLVRNDEAAEALMALGYSPQDAAAALRDIASDLEVQERVTLALRRGA